jgi:hypothetical protein
MLRCSIAMRCVKKRKKKKMSDSSLAPRGHSRAKHRLTNRPCPLVLSNSKWPWPSRSDVILPGKATIEALQRTDKQEDKHLGRQTTYGQLGKSPLHKIPLEARGSEKLAEIFARQNEQLLETLELRGPL